VIIMYVVYSNPRRTSDWTVLDVWPACPLSLDACAWRKTLAIVEGQYSKKYSKIS
jgi:hypothetical protein